MPPVALDFLTKDATEKESRILLNEELHGWLPVIDSARNKSACAEWIRSSSMIDSDKYLTIIYVRDWYRKILEDSKSGMEGRPFL